MCRCGGARPARLVLPLPGMWNKSPKRSHIVTNYSNPLQCYASRRSNSGIAAQHAAGSSTRLPRLLCPPGPQAFGDLRRREHHQPGNAGDHPHESPVVVQDKGDDRHHGLQGTHTKSSQPAVEQRWRRAWMPPPAHGFGTTYTQGSQEPNQAQAQQRLSALSHTIVESHQHDLHGCAKLQKVARGVAASCQRHQVGLQCVMWQQQEAAAGMFYLVWQQVWWVVGSVQGSQHCARVW